MTKEERKKVIELRKSGMSANKIATIIPAPLNTLKSYIKRNKSKLLEDEKIRDNEDERKKENESCSKKTICKNCGNEITINSYFKPRVFCNKKCKEHFYNKKKNIEKRKTLIEKKCLFCNESYKIYESKHSKFCSHDCYIKWRLKYGTKRQDVSHDNLLNGKIT